MRKLKYFEIIKRNEGTAAATAVRSFFIHFEARDKMERTFFATSKKQDVITGKKSPTPTKKEENVKGE